jgi:ATP-binding cassette subfamily C protein
MNRPAKVSISEGPKRIVAGALRESSRAFWSVGLFSCAVNLLMLAGPLYMLQIYDRVLTSRSVPTLIALSVFIVVAYIFQAVFDLVRTRVLVRAASILDQHLGHLVHAAVVQLGVRSRVPGEAQQPVRDLDAIRAFLVGSGPIAVVDLPWIPVFLAICFLVHPWLGAVALAGGVVLVSLTLMTERASREPGRTVSREGGARTAMIEAARRNSESATAMGMSKALASRWAALNDGYLRSTSRASDVIGSYGAVSKIVRLLLQSLILGVGAYLVIYQELSAGAMIAASIMMGRGLAPIETAIANWRAFVAARQSYRRLSETLSRMRLDNAATALPKPSNGLEVEQITVSAPGGEAAPILRDVRFGLAAGEALGVIGPSGAGKTSLARALVGIWHPIRGSVRLDGAALDQWDEAARGRHIGFLSQSIELFDGTIAENVARMQEMPDSEAVLRAAKAAGAHDLILRLPGGYDHQIGDAGSTLSAGQRQRVALARALYGDPFLVVLDEPYSNLDHEGDLALMNAIQGVKARKGIVIIVSHRPSGIAVCDKLLILQNGTQQAFGPRDEIMQKYFPRQLQPVPPTGAFMAGANR